VSARVEGPAVNTRDSSRSNREKESRLIQNLKQHPAVAIAFSGGVDSTYLLAVAIAALGADRVLALTADSSLIPRSEIALARDLARQLDASHRVLDIDPFDAPDVVANHPDRCYHCKRVVFSQLLDAAREAGIEILLHGANLDDRSDYRPGQRAADELGVRAPLDEVGLTKAEIRHLSRERGLPTWDMPAQACLASRVPYGVPLSREALDQVEQAEDFLRRQFGLRTLRVRYHGPIARIELPADDWPLILTPAAREQIVAAFRRIGFGSVALDLAGFQSGSMNRLIDQRGNSTT
jgi:pyridinium-3,5-biscarboxylic acid mononucleotide sulfurtransferase